MNTSNFKFSTPLIESFVQLTFIAQHFNVLLKYQNKIHYKIWNRSKIFSYPFRVVRDANLFWWTSSCRFSAAHYWQRVSSSTSAADSLSGLDERSAEVLFTANVDPNVSNAELHFVLNSERNFSFKMVWNRRSVITSIKLLENRPSFPYAQQFACGHYNETAKSSTHSHIPLKMSCNITDDPFQYHSLY